VCGGMEDCRDQRRAEPFSVIVEALDTELVRGLLRSEDALSIRG
jgi:hypothetical protein